MSTDMKEFAEKVKAELISRGLFKEEDLIIEEVVKNNNVKMTGIVIRVNPAVNPILYLNELVDCPMDEIIGYFKKTSDECNKGYFLAADEMCSWELHQNDVLPVLLNKEDNELYLKNKVRTEFLDLAVAYVVKVKHGVVFITNDIFNMWAITKEELVAKAYENFEQKMLDAIKIVRINEVIKSLADKEIKENLEPIDMYVVTTSDMRFGATSIMFEEVQRRIEYVLGTSEFYILPSSINEVIIINHEGITPEQLREMVVDVNSHCLGISEILSNNVYRYVKGKGIEIA